MSKIINTTKAPAAIGPYAQGIQTQELIFVSGQLPVDPETGKMNDDVKKQTEQSLKNVKAILEEVGSSMDKIVKTTIFIQDMNDFVVINEMYSSFFNGCYPARSCVEVSRLPKDAKVEIEAIATK